MGRKRKDSSRTVIDPKLLPTNITPPPPPDLKLQVRGNPTSGYRVCTYFARWRPVVKETDSTPRKEGSCVATHVKTVGYIEKHKRSGKIIFVPDFYLEVPTLRYYDVYRDYDHCTYQLRPDWRETWYLTERSLYQPPEESLNLKQELSRLRKLVSAQKRAAAQGIALELDLEAPNDAPELGPQKEAVRGSYNQYMMGSIPTTDALQEGVYRAGDKERTEPSWAAQYALTMGEPSVAPNIVPAIAKAGKRAPVRAEPPGPDAYLSLTDDPNSEWHVKPQHDVLPPSQPQERLQRQAELDKILDPRQGKAPARKSGTKYRPQALKVESLPAGAPHSMVQPRPAVPEAAEPAHVSLTAQPGEHQPTCRSPRSLASTRTTSYCRGYLSLVRLMGSRTVRRMVKPGSVRRCPTSSRLMRLMKQGSVHARASRRSRVKPCLIVKLGPTQLNPLGCCYLNLLGGHYLSWARLIRCSAGARMPGSRCACRAQCA